MLDTGETATLNNGPANSKNGRRFSSPGSVAPPPCRMREPCDSHWRLWYGRTTRALQQALKARTWSQDLILGAGFVTAASQVREFRVAPGLGEGRHPQQCREPCLTHAR